MKKIILDVADVPTKSQLQQAASRLLKDYQLLNRWSGSKDVEDSKAMAEVAAFLDMLAKREASSLRRDAVQNDRYVSAMRERLVDFYVSLPEGEAKQAIEEINNKRNTLENIK